MLTSSIEFTMPKIRIGRIVAPIVAIGIIVATYHRARQGKEIMPNRTDLDGTKDMDGFFAVRLIRNPRKED